MEDHMGPMETVEVLAPFLTKPMVNELCSGRKWADYRERKLQLLRYRIARAWWRQRRLAKWQQGRETRFVDGVGQHKAVIDEELVAFTRSKYGRLSFHDPDHLNYILKMHPELRVPAPKPRYHMVNGFKAVAAGVSPAGFGDAADTAATTEMIPSAEGGAGDGVRATPATAVEALPDRYASPIPRTGSAHEIPAPLCLAAGTAAATAEN